MSDNTPKLKPTLRSTIPASHWLRDFLRLGSNDSLHRSIYDDILTTERTAGYNCFNVAERLGGHAFLITVQQNTSAHNTLTLDCNGATPGSYNVVLSDILGRVLFSKALNVNGTTQLQIETFGDGMYLAKMSNGVATKTEKVILK